MTYVIAEPCVDIKDRACVDECPVEAIFYENNLPAQWIAHIRDDARSFDETLPGRGTPLGSAGGAARLGAVAADTPLIVGVPPQPPGGGDRA